MSDPEIQDALRNLIRGRGVKRGTHSLVLDERDMTQEFLALLSEEGYRKMLVDEVGVEPGRRAPAFFVKEGRAHFGWVFWEAFFPGRMRKIFASVHRNEKSDWAVVLGRAHREPVYANLALKEDMDLDHPSDL